MHGKNPWVSGEDFLTNPFFRDQQPICPPPAALSFMGVTSALVFANLGAAYGTAKSGVGIASMGVARRRCHGDFTGKNRVISYGMDAKYGEDGDVT